LHLELERNKILFDDLQISKYELKGPLSSFNDELTFTRTSDLTDTIDPSETLDENSNSIWLSHEDDFENGGRKFLIKV
jgi:hypothetical protein